MHELSIALSIIEGASQEALNRGGAQVHAVHLKLGALSGVVRDALLFSYDIACAGTLLEGSKLVIEDVPVVVYCRDVRRRKNIGINPAILLSHVRRADARCCQRQAA